MEVIGSIYTGVTEDFQRGVYPIARCVKAENHFYYVYSDGHIENANGHIMKLYSDKAGDTVAK